MLRETARHHIDILPNVNGFELYLLGRRLMRIAETAVLGTGDDQRLPANARVVLAEAVERPGITAGEVSERTGLGADAVTAAVDWLRAEGLLGADAVGQASPLLRPALGANPPDELTGPRPAELLAKAIPDAEPGEVEQFVETLAALSGRLTEPLLRTSSRGFDTAYETQPPWDIGRPQPSLVALAEAGLVTGSVLDVGCGSGEHALLAAELGRPALGVDFSAKAIELARRKAEARGLTARFLEWDATALGGLGERFDTVIDSGLYHVFSDVERTAYVRGLAEVLRPGGRVLLLCFSDRQPGGFGPRRVRAEEITGSFGDGWRVDAIEPVTLELTISAAGVQAWRATITRM